MSFSLFPRTVYKTKSKISGEVVVKEQLGRCTLHVQRMIQSGGMVRGIWKKAVKKVQSSKLKVKSCLILGLGGGTVVKIIDKMFLKAKIVGVEIDPEIIKIGKKYFSLGEIKNLEIVNADVFEWIEERFVDTNHRSKFNLIIVDLYIGGEFPKEAESDEFLRNIKKLLSKNGLVIFNRLKTDKTENFEERLKKHFSSIKKVTTPTNYFFIAAISSLKTPTRFLSKAKLC